MCTKYYIFLYLWAHLHNLMFVCLFMFKRLLQTRGPYKITSNIKKKTLCKYYQYHREINYIEIK